MSTPTRLAWDVAGGGRRCSWSTVSVPPHDDFAGLRPSLESGYRVPAPDLRLHPVAGTEGGLCPTCAVPVPCPTARALQP